MKESQQAEIVGIIDEKKQEVKPEPKTVRIHDTSKIWVFWDDGVSSIGEQRGDDLEMVLTLLVQPAPGDRISVSMISPYGASSTQSRTMLTFGRISNFKQRSRIFDPVLLPESDNLIDVYWTARAKLMSPKSSILYTPQ